MQTMVSTHVWQRRTHRIIAMAVIIIGLTMMISTIPQCIYIGLIFIMLSLGWLAWMRMKDKKGEPPAPSNHPHASVSPVLFLVASQNFTQRQCVPTPPDPNDKPPSYDQIIKLDGLPPDYFTVLTAKPPRYEDIENCGKSWPMTVPFENLPSVHVNNQESVSSSSRSISRNLSSISTISNGSTNCSFSDGGDTTTNESCRATTSRALYTSIVLDNSPEGEMVTGDDHKESKSSCSEKEIQSRDESGPEVEKSFKNDEGHRS